MRITQLLIAVFISCTTLVNAQDKQFTLEEIWGGTFRTSSLESLHSMNNGQQYSVLEFNSTARTTSVAVYDYATAKKSKTLVDSKDISNLDFFTGYTFSKDEKRIILNTEEEAIYRRSSRGVYYVFDTETKELVKIDAAKIQEPTFSPDGTKVAYVKDNNIYVFDIASKKSKQLTSDGKKNEIINGLTDWVYEEEFAFVRAFDWNASGKQIAYIRFDEREVPEFSMDVYGKQLYPQQDVFKYPKAGEKNALVSLHIIDIENKSTKEVDLSNYNDFYIPRIEWTKNPDVLSAQVINRHQNNLDLLFIDGSTATSKVVLNEKDEAYIDITDDLTFLEDNSFIWTSEKSGYNHIYHYDATGKLIKQLTTGNWEVTSYYGYDTKNKKIYYQSVENGSINRDIYAVKLNGKSKKRLSTDNGTNNASFSADFTYYINQFSSATAAPLFTLNKAKDGSVVRILKDNKQLEKTLGKYDMAAKEFSTIKINGEDLNMWMIKPKDFDASKKYPLLMYQYSGPGSQSVANSWNRANDYWYHMLAQQGYIVACVDGRGTGFKGAKFKKVTYLNLVKHETEDQIAAAKELGKLPFIDQSRIGIWGWSFGGHMSTNCLLKGSDVFKMAIAVAPVTTWRFYDSIYTERYMRTPQENPSGYDDNSPLNYPEQLKGNYLLVHGSGDDNVHVQHTMRMVEALIQANKQFDWAIYPDKNHGIYGGNTRLHLYTKMHNFVKSNL